MRDNFFVDIPNVKRFDYWVKISFVALKREGFFALIKKVIKRVYFYFLGVDFSPESLERYKIENIERASVCNHILDKSFDEIVDKLKDFDLDITKGVFLDYGSGKAFSLYKASKAGFREVIGVEFVENFVKVGRENLKKLSIKNAKIIHLDAVKFKPPLDTRVIFFHNPFDEIIFEKVLKNIEETKFKTPPIIVYHYPICESVFEKRERFVLLEKFISPTSREISNFYRLIS